MKERSCLVILLFIFHLSAQAQFFSSKGLYFSIENSEYAIVVSRDVLKMRNSGSTINIPSFVSYNGKSYPVTEIGNQAFSRMKIKSVKIPNSILRIGKDAFKDCSQLKSIEIPISVKYVGDNAFDGCSSLTTVIGLPKDDVEMGKNVFKDSPYENKIDVSFRAKSEPLPSSGEVDKPNEKMPQTSSATQQYVSSSEFIRNSDVDFDIPKGKANNDNTFAIIIANENYQEEAKVEFALNDGEIFQQYCYKVLGLPNDNIHFRKDATLNNIRRELDWIRKVANAYEGTARIIVYYAGHGIPDEKTGAGYLLPVDGSGSSLSTGYSLSELYKMLGDLPAKDVIVFIDACFSGSKRGEGMLASARGVAIKAKPSVPKGKMVIFSAAQGDETAYPLKDEGHGMFTYYLLKKLRETKGDVPLQDLSDYVITQVKRKSIVANGKSQTPTVNVSPAMGDKWKQIKLR